jgi:NAD(P)-dependent dehydrogenase (short-subunit alcohol dehydrogenase family)
MTDRLKQRHTPSEGDHRVPLAASAATPTAGAAVFLASEASAFVSGHVLVIDGGYTAW